MNTYTMTVTEHRRVQCIYAQTCIYAVIYQQSILTLQIISVLSCLLSFTSTPLRRYTGSVLKDNHDCTLLLSLFPYYHFMPSHIKLIQKLPKDKKEEKKKEKENFTYPTPSISNICPRLLPRSSTTAPMCSSGTSTVAICKQSTC